MLLSGMGHFWGQPMLPQRLGQPFVADCPVGPGDPRLGTEFGELDARPLRERMISSYCKINRVVHDQQALEAVRQYQRRIHPVVDQSNVKMSRDDQPYCLIRLPLRDPKPQLLMFLTKPGYGLGKYGPRGGGESGDSRSPTTRSRCRSSSLSALSTSDRIACARLASRAPAGVSRTPRPYGSISRWPTSRCSLAKLLRYR